MPYIPGKDRLDLLEGITTPRTEGELNFVLTKKILEVISVWGEGYKTYNAILGVLEAVKLELYRRKISGYEDLKKQQNGDVY